jgi:hypothetical protein
MNSLAFVSTCIHSLNLPPDLQRGVYAADFDLPTTNASSQRREAKELRLLTTEAGKRTIL